MHLAILSLYVELFVAWSVLEEHGEIGEHKSASHYISCGISRYGDYLSGHLVNCKAFAIASRNYGITINGISQPLGQLCQMTGAGGTTTQRWIPIFSHSAATLCDAWRSCMFSWVDVRLKDRVRDVSEWRVYTKKEGRGTILELMWIFSIKSEGEESM